MGKGCPCVSRRKGTFLMGITYLVLGNINTIVVTLLFTLHGHEVLWGPYEDPLLRRQSLGRILIFYIPPAVFTLLLGILLILAAHRNDTRLAELSFIISTGYVCGAGMEVVAMKLYGMSWVTISPMLILLIIQMYNFVITADYRDHMLNHGKLVKTSTERRRLREDPEVQHQDNGESETSVGFDAGQLVPPEAPAPRRNSTFSVRFKNDKKDGP